MKRINLFLHFQSTPSFRRFTRLSDLLSAAKRCPPSLVSIVASPQPPQTSPTPRTTPTLRAAGSLLPPADMLAGAAACSRELSTPTSSSRGTRCCRVTRPRRRFHSEHHSTPVKAAPSTIRSQIKSRFLGAALPAQPPRFSAASFPPRRTRSQAATVAAPRSERFLSAPLKPTATRSVSRPSGSSGCPKSTTWTLWHLRWDLFLASISALHPVRWGRVQTTPESLVLIRIAQDRFQNIHHLEVGKYTVPCSSALYLLVQHPDPWLCNLALD